MDIRGGECQLVVSSDLGQYYTLGVLHPVYWTFTESQEWEAMAKFVRKAVQAVERAKAAASEEAVKWAEAHPAIVEYMTLDVMDDGSPRVTSMICMFHENGLYKGALQDRQEGVSLWAAAQSIPEVLDALEARLQAGDGDWRPMRGQAKPTARKR